MISFEFEEARVSDLYFSMVEDDQFFIDEDGWLCQKVSEDAYICIADEEGIPTACYVTTKEDGNVHPNLPIIRILPRLTKVSF